MKSNKYIAILLILSLLCAFSLFEFKRKSYVKVLDIITPSEIVVDLNSNNRTDLGETICIPEIETFTSNLDRSQTELQNKLNLTFEDAIKIGYVTDNFAENLLESKNVKINFTGDQNPNCRFADIVINNESYINKLYNSGFAIKNFQPTKSFEEQLERAKKLNLVILNHRSEKYHKLTCEYGLVAHDSVIIPLNQIPKTSKPCKFCHIETNKVSYQIPKNTYPTTISAGDVKVFLSDLTTVLKPDNKCSTPVCKEVLSKINSSNSAIDISLYGWDTVPEIFDAFKRAKSRGVKIRIAYDNSINSYYPETEKLLALADKKSGDDVKNLMHNKFMIIDGKDIITGSMNFSKTGFSGFNTNCVFSISSEELAKIYTDEFEQMIIGKFHHEKSKVIHKQVFINDTKITPLFSPKDKIIVTDVIPLINSAQKYIYIPAFILTHDKLAESLINAKNRGVDVKIIIDATNTNATRSKVKYLRDSGVSVKIENYAGKVHSKSIIIDDKYVIAGSMNFTNSGENKNDENVLILENQRIAHYYKEFFEYLWAKIPDKYLLQSVSAESKFSIGSCSDGIDNDYDGKIDMFDESCK